jgi:hypothetical protein
MLPWCFKSTGRCRRPFLFPPHPFLHQNGPRKNTHRSSIASYPRPSLKNRRPHQIHEETPPPTPFLSELCHRPLFSPFLPSLTFNLAPQCCRASPSLPPTPEPPPEPGRGLFAATESPHHRCASLVSPRLQDLAQCHPAFAQVLAMKMAQSLDCHCADGEHATVLPYARGPHGDRAHTVLLVWPSRAALSIRPSQPCWASGRPVHYSSLNYFLNSFSD